MTFAQLPSSLMQIMRSVPSAACVVALVSLIGAAPRQASVSRSDKPAPERVTVATAVAADQSPAELLQDMPVHDMIAAANSRVDGSNHATKAAVHAPSRQKLMEVTAYCPCTRCCGPNAAGITASGLHVSYNNGQFVAADPSLPFGAKLLIPGYSDHPVEVIDRGSAIRGDKLDVFFPSHEAALEWGRRWVAVTIVD